MGLPECATPPQEVYELAKRRGMDFVTITDHDTIAGVLQIADRPDVFVSEELTAHFRGEPQAVHVLCYGITPEDHEWLQAHRGDVEICAAYMYEREIVCALAHPYYTVAAPLTARHRRRLAQLFGIWEIRNGARARELNMPAATYIVDARRQSASAAPTTTPGSTSGAPTPRRPRLARPRSSWRTCRRATSGWAERRAAPPSGPTRQSRSPPGRSGWMATGPVARSPTPRTVMTMVRRLLREGDARAGPVGGDLDARGRPLPAARLAAARSNSTTSTRRA